MPEIKRIFLLCENGLEALLPTVKSAVDDMMACFPEHKADYPVTVLGNWRSPDYAYQNQNGSTVLRSHQSVEWYIERARQKAKQE